MGCPGFSTSVDTFRGLTIEFISAFTIFNSIAILFFTKFNIIMIAIELVHLKVCKWFVSAI